MKSFNRQTAQSKIPIDSRHDSVRREIWRVFKEETGLDCPWSGKHAKILQTVLQAAANWPVARWHTAILGRFASEGVNVTEDPALWMNRLPSYARGPVNRFGKLPAPAASLRKFAELCARYEEALWQRPLDGKL